MFQFIAFITGFLKMLFLKTDSGGTLKSGIHCCSKREEQERKCLYQKAVSKQAVINKKLDIVECLQKANEAAGKFLVHTLEQMRVRELIAGLTFRDYFDYEYFNSIYKTCVEKKRRKLLADIDEIEEEFLSHLYGRWEAQMLYDAMPAETGMKLAVLKTYYIFLEDDNVFCQKAFIGFLRKKTEENPDGEEYRLATEYYLKHIDKGLMDFDDEDLGVFFTTGWFISIGLRKLWTEFLRSGSDYTDIIPDKRPGVAYLFCHVNIPCFIFHEPHEGEYSREEFYRKFVRECETANYNPLSKLYHKGYRSYEEDFGIDLFECRIREDFETAYADYHAAVHRFQNIQKRLEKNNERSRSSRQGRSLPENV